MSLLQSAAALLGLGLLASLAQAQQSTWIVGGPTSTLSLVDAMRLAQHGDRILVAESQSVNL